MRIRFLQQTPSSNPAFPFQAGQIINVDPSPDWIALCDGVRAQLLRDEAVETATEPDHERAVMAKARKGRS